MCGKQHTRRAFGAMIRVLAYSCVYGVCVGGTIMIRIFLSRQGAVVLERIKLKLNSERGASLSMALMLFLVVTIVASVALTAATAVAGRHSQLVEMDQSYYNVTSAANFLWDKLEDGVTVNIACECDATEDDDGNYTPVDDTWEFSVDDAFVLGDTLDESSATLFQILSVDALFPPSIHVDEEDYGCEITLPDGIDTISIDDMSPLEFVSTEQKYKSFKVTVDSASPEFRDVMVTPTRTGDDKFQFVFIEDDGGEPSFDSFRCTLVASAGFTGSGPQISETGETDTSTGDDLYHIKWETSVTWTPEGIKLGGAAS